MHNNYYDDTPAASDLLVNTHELFAELLGSSQMQETSSRPLQTMDVEFKSQTEAFGSV